MPDPRDEWQTFDLARLLLVGVSYRSADAMLRESLLVPEAQAEVRLAELRAAGVYEGLLISTCDRVELLVNATTPSSDADRLRGLLAEWAGMLPAEFQAYSYALSGEAALRHLFAVAAALDSQVIGEPQVLGQLKESHRTAAALGMTGPLIESVMQAAYAAAKRVRRETPLAERPVTLAAAALRTARDLHGELSDRRLLLLGLGETAELLASEFKTAGLADLTVMHPQELRAEIAARRLRCHLRPWSELPAALAAADLVISAHGSGRYTLTAAAVRAALKERRRHPILIIDAALPHDVEPAVGDLDGAFVYDLDDLERVARQGKEGREGAAVAAWRVLGEELQAFQRAHAERRAVPAVAALRGHAERLRREILADRRLDAEAATRLLLARLLHDPSEVLRHIAAESPDEQQAMERHLLRLFRIESARKDEN